MREPWEQDPDAWKRETTPAPSGFALSIRRATVAFQRLGDAIALWQLLYGDTKLEEEEE